MPFTKEEIAELKNNPATLAIAERIEQEQAKMENMIPQSEFDKRMRKVSESVKVIKTSLLEDITDPAERSIVEKLEGVEAVMDYRKKHIEKKMVQAGEVSGLQKLLEDEKTAHQTALEQLQQDKADAEAHRKAKKAFVEKCKKDMGDKWSESFATLPLEDLAKIAGTETPIPGVVTSSGKPKSEYEGKNPFSKKTRNLAEQARLKITNPTLAAQLEADAGKE